MDLYVGLGDQRHAVRLLQLFYLQHSRANATFPTYGDDDGDQQEGAAAAAKSGSRRRRRRRRRDDDGNGGNGDTANRSNRKAAAERAADDDDEEEEDPRAASDPFYRMVGDTSALDGRVRIFPGVEEEGEEAGEGEEEARDGQGGGGRHLRRLVFARQAVEMGPCTNRHGPAGLYISGLTVPPLVVIAWLKRSFVGRHVQRAFFIPLLPPGGGGGGPGAPPPTAASRGTSNEPPPPPSSPLSCWGGMARTAEQAAAEGWAQAARVSGLDGVRVACSDRRLQAEVLAAIDRLHEEGEGEGAEEEKQQQQKQQQQQPPLRLEPTASATHALCVARVSVADLRAAGTPLMAPDDDGAPDPALAERAAERRRELHARRGKVGAVEAAAAAALEVPHRYVWSLAPVSWLYRLAWDEPATHGGCEAGGEAGVGGGGAGDKANAAACAHAVHKLDEALRVLGLAGDGTDAEDGRAARADVSPEERAAWDAYAASSSYAAAPGSRLRLRRALDVGAAPGSWSALMARRILAEQRRRHQAAEAEAEAEEPAAAVVVAVDPADLDPSCLELPIVRHLRVRAGTDEAARQIREALAVATATATAPGGEGGKGGEKTTAEEQQRPLLPPPPPPPQVDLLTCDANTHPKDTIEKLVVPLLPHLRPGGFLVVTLKLHGSGRVRGGVSADVARLLEKAWGEEGGEGEERHGGRGRGTAMMLPGAALWLMANTNHERTYVARKRVDWVD